MCDSPHLARFAPDVRPIVSWLMKKRHFSAERIDDLLEEVRDPNAYVVAMAHDALPHTAKQAACTISFDPDASVRRVDIETLQEAGFLVCDSREPESWMMPGLVHHHVTVFAKALRQKEV